ncbi:hypothetical protein BC628DRAFT_1363408 [Trametes gibbosa]|uniref:Zinc finger protein 215 n=1 Tax=Trametes gibbosa TaxID=160864 RepID=A0A6B9KD00_9APHY|nr:hypothetical protein BC628DRAFT_1363408 [Trametes gibbosa]QHA24588.1 zinc finger protein 215 [Trametes gibbosa]
MPTEIATQAGTADAVHMRPSAQASYPRTRSQTRASPRLKRKYPDAPKSPPTRPAKIARATPIASATPSEDFSPEAVVEPSASASTSRTMWPPDVPRSMLFTFRVGPAIHMYDSATGTPTSGTTRPSDAPQFPAAGPEPMFDHSWRMSFIESVHTPKQVPSPNSADANARKHPPSGVSYFCAQNTPSALRPSTPSKPMSTAGALPQYCLPRRGDRDDENVSPAGHNLKLGCIQVPKQTVVKLPAGAEFLVPLSSSGSLAHDHRRDTDSLVSPQPHLSVACLGPEQSSSRIQPGLYHSRQPHTLDAFVPNPSLTWVPPGHLPFFNSHHEFALGHAPHLSSSNPPLGGTQNATTSPHYVSAPASLAFPVHPFHHAPHIPAFSLPPHPGTSPSYGRPPYPPLGHLPSAYVSAPPHAQTNAGSARFSDRLGGQDSIFAQSHPAHPLPSHPIPFDPYLPMEVPPPFPKFPPWKHASGHGAPWSMFYESIKSARDIARGRGKDRPCISEGARESRQVQATALDICEPEGPSNMQARDLTYTHKCPFCPRVFSLPNSLTIHLKWHWGASGLQWKRGISHKGKTIERALRDAERRREDAAKRQEEENFPGVPTSISVAHSLPYVSPNFRASKNFSIKEIGDPCIMPIIAQSTFNAFNLPFYSSQSSVASDSPYVSPTETQGSHAFPPPISSVPSMMHSSLPHTPELLTDTGSANSASTGRGSPTWSENLFGCDEDDVDAEGEIDEGDDLFAGRLDIPIPVVKSDAAGPDDAAGVYSSSAMHGSLYCGRQSTILCANRNTASWTVPFPLVGRHRSMSVRIRPRFVYAPRLAPLGLPPAFFDEDEEEDCIEPSMSVHVEDHLDDPFRVRSLDGSEDDAFDPLDLAPLDGLPPLQTLPELDAAFQNLSVF